MPEDVMELLYRRMVDFDGKLDTVDVGTPEFDAYVKAIDVIAKILETDYANGQTAFDAEERRRIDENSKKEQAKAEKRKFAAEMTKAIAGPSIAAGASIFGSLMLLRLKTALEKDNVYLGADAFKWAYNFILKLKA